MALAAKLELRQGQGLVITPQLQQAIKLLQLSNIELEAFVEAELEKNPLLQRDERDQEPDDAPAPEAASAEAAAAADIDAHPDDVYGDASPGERDSGEAGEDRAPAAGEAGGAIDWSRTGRGGAELTDDMEQGLARALTLADYLEQQAALAGFEGPDRVVASALIDAVDDGGYLRADLVDMAERLGCGLERIEGVLVRLHGFEPV